MTKNAKVTSPDLIVQTIEVTWTKQSRGMPGAARRNQVPKTFDLPPAEGAPLLFHHRVRTEEARNFHPDSTTRFRDRIPVNWEHGLGFIPDQDRLQVFFRYNRSEHGLPPRSQARVRIFDLCPGRTGQFFINGRFVSTRGQFYRSLTVNLAWKAGVCPGLFTNGVPDRMVQRSAHLF